MGEVNSEYRACHWSTYDFFVFFILIPVLLFSYFFIPPEFRGFFTLEFGHPTLISMYLSNFAHADYAHYLDNITLYFVLVYLFFNIEISKRRFYILSAVFLLVAPFVVSGVSIVRPPFEDVQNSMGFSGVVSAYLGYLPVVVYYRLKESYSLRLNPTFVLIFIILSFALWMLGNPRAPAYLKLFFLASAGFLILINREPLAAVYSIIEEKRTTIRASKNLMRALRASFVFSATVVFLVFPIQIIVPLQFSSTHYLPNWVAHYAGYCFGVAAGLFAEIFER